MNRTRVFWMVALVVLALDAGRSLNAHHAYPTPSAEWKPEPSLYSDLTWPLGSDVPASATTGQRVFAQHCAGCHGPDGHANGPAAPSMHPKPRDFSAGEIKFKSTAAGQPPTDDDLLATIRDGLSASTMPGFGDVLSADELRAVVGQVKVLAKIAASGKALEVPARPAADPHSLERGKALFARVGCNACHGDDGTTQKSFEDARGSSFYAADLTRPWTFHASRTPEQLWLRLTTGIVPGPMPSYAESISPADRWDLVAYVLSLAKTAPWEPGGKLSGPGQSADLIRRGEYLTRFQMCQLCHTQIDRTGIYREEDQRFTGGMAVRSWPHSIQVSRNLTPDETGLGAFSEEQIVDVLRFGRDPSGRQLNLWGMPWPVFHRLQDGDAHAIAHYLKSLPPIHHPTPDVVHFGAVETLIGKLVRGLPAADPPKLEYDDGDFANLASAAPLERALTGAQRIVLALGFLLWIFAAPAERRWPQSIGGWVKTVAVLLGLVVFGFVGNVLNQLPALNKIPPEKLVQGVLAGLPDPDTSKMSPEQAALVERGRYIYTVTSCGFCHRGRGNGGSKASWKPFGSIYVRNISSDREAGIGAWTDAQIARAFRSGVGRDGRALHWQAMPWDLFSNFDEEDVRALVAFLRQLPPIATKVPASRLPAADDCDRYSFFVKGGTPPGCSE